MEATSPSPLIRWLGHLDFEALARGACDAPADDAPRLVLADWLRDRGWSDRWIEVNTHRRPDDLVRAEALIRSRLAR